MSLVYRSIRQFVIDPNIDTQAAKNYVLHTDIIRGDLVEYLFSKVRKVSIEISRSERLGFDIEITYLLAPNKKIIMSYHSKKHTYIQFTDNYLNPDIPIIYQKLLLDKLPLQVRNVLLYYLYPTHYNDPLVENLNVINGWKMDNKWDTVTNFVFSLVEVLNKSKYDKSLKYDLKLNLEVCKQM